LRHCVAADQQIVFYGLRSISAVAAGPRMMPLGQLAPQASARLFFVSETT